MRIKKLKLTNFMSHKESYIDLPQKGIVLVTGTNGSGKSSIAEGVATAVWGKTLRGSVPWVENKKGKVTLEAEVDSTSYTFERTASKGGKAAGAFSPATSTDSTTTKMQAAINDVVGPFDVWRRCSVFSSQDAAHFTLSTDAERKRLLETLLGLDKFDTALKVCREEHKQISGKVRALEGDLIRNKTAEDLCVSSLEYNKSKHTVEKTRVKHHLMDDSELLRKRELLQEQQNAHSDLCVQIDQARSKMYAMRAECDSIRKDLLVYANEECPTCHQSLGGKESRKLQQEKTKKLAALEVELSMVVDTVASLKEEDSVLGRVIREGQNEVSKQEAYRTSEECALLTHLKEAIEKSEADLITIKKEARIIKKKLDNLQYDLALNENTQTVLGTKGVRAHILTSALEALELTANKWLKKIMSEKATIKISPYVQNKTGGKRDAISLEIQGLGDGNGYKSLSGGQRRRVDVSILLGLAELGQTTTHSTPGTVFFDEVFDSLDEEGGSLVGNVLEEMAEERAVVVISHAPEFVEGLSVHAHIRVFEGQVTYA